MNRIEQPLVGYLGLPRCVGQISRVIKLRLEGFRFAVFAMTRSALTAKKSARIDSRRTPAGFRYRMRRISQTKATQNDTHAERRYFRSRMTALHIYLRILRASLTL